MSTRLARKLPSRALTDLAAVALVVLAAVALIALFVWGSASLLLRQKRAEVTGHAAAIITAMQAQDELQLRQIIRQAELEVRFIADTPPVAGIGRALLNNGLDPVDGNTLAQLRARLELIGQAYLTARPEVFQLRLIGVADGGRELVRVVQDHAGTVTLVGADGLQQKGNRDYFRAAVGLPEGAVHVSPIDLNVENDRIEVPHRPTLRAALPVRNDRGEMFAVVVVNVLAQPLLDVVGGTSGLPDVQEWVKDAAGHYLWHPQPGKAFAHLLNPPGTPRQEEFTPAPDAVRPAGLPGDADAGVWRAPDGADWLIFTRTLGAPEADGTGGVVLHSGIPLQVLATRAWQGAGDQVILVWAMGLLVIGLGTLLLLRWERLTRPESAGAAAAGAAAADDPAERRAWYVGAGVAVLVLLLGGGGWWFVRGQRLAEARAGSLFHAELVGQHLKTGLQSAAHAARVLAELRPDTLSSQAEFERRAAELNSVTPETLVLQWSPQAIVRFSQPLAGNERAIGLDLRADPRVRDLIARTIQTGQPFWDGPFPLRQGGLGMVYRVPVYRPGAPVSEQDFLGLATCLVNLSETARKVDASRPLFHFAASVQSGGAAPVDILPAVPGAVAATAATAEVSLALDPSDTLAADTVRFKVTAALKDPPVGGHWLALALIGATAALFGWLAHVMETRRAGRHRLLQLSARLERSAQAAKVGFWEYDLPTGKVIWSRELLEFRGITEGEFDGTLEGVQRFTHPEDRELLAAAIRGARAGEPFIIEFRVVRPDGQIRWLEARGVLQTDASGQPVRLVGSETDITARKLAAEKLASEQARLQAVIDASPAVIYACRVDGDWPATFISANITEQFGYSPEECLHPGWWVSTLHPEERDGVLAGVGALLEKGRHVHEYRMATKAGDWRWVHDELVLLRDAQGKPLSATGAILDITARKLAEAENRKLALAVARTHNAVILTDAEGRIEWVNEGFTRITGYSLAEALGRKPGDFLQGPETDPETVRRMSAATRAGEGFQVEILSYTKAGRSYWLSIDAQPLHDAGGRLTGFMAIEADITERKVVEAALRQFKSTLDATHDCVFMFRPESLQFFYVNQGACEQVGYSEAELLGMHPYDIKPEIPEPKFRAMIAPLLDGSEPSARFETLHRRKDGTDVPVEVFLQYIAPGGEPPRFVAIVTDITKRKAAEEKLAEQSNFQRTLLTSAGAAIIAGDVNGLITLFNPAAEELLGYRADEMVGKLTPGVFHDPAEVVARAAELSAELGRTIEPGFEVFAAKARGGEPETREWTYVRKDGGRVPVLLTVSALRNDAGEITGFLGVARDITHRRVATEQLQQRLAERETLLQEVHHRVKNNLQVVTSLLAMQQTRTTSPEIAAAFQLSRDRIAAIALVHEQLYGTQDLDRVDLGTFVRQLGANILQASAAGDRVDFAVVGESYPILLQAAVPCALLLNELLTNALKHAFPGDRRGKIEVELKLDADGTRHIVLRDDGVGMDPALAKGVSTSLGMRLVNRLVDQLDATLEHVPSAAGTEFHLTLPPPQNHP